MKFLEVFSTIGTLALIGVLIFGGLHGFGALLIPIALAIGGFWLFHDLFVTKHARGRGCSIVWTIITIAFGLLILALLTQAARLGS